MNSVRPNRDAYTVQIPLTFDGGSAKPGVSKERFLISAGLLFAWVAITIVCLLLAEGLSKIGIPFVLLLILIPLIRFIVIRENYFRKKREKILDNDFSYPHSIFWDIHEISPKYPYICRYMSGLKAIFVRFDKDVIVGKELDNQFNHFEAISEAYLQMSKRGINCVHIDYMDSVGKDDRMVHLFDIARESENSDLRDLLTHIFDNVEYTMKKSYATYDVYAFFCSEKEEIFWGELEIVLDYFLNANYLRYSILDRDEIGDVVKSVMNVDNFSVNRTSESLFLESGISTHLKPIWIERNGEKKILNKTREEIEEERNVSQVEKQFKKTNKRKKKSKYVQKVVEQQEIDLFDDTNNDDEIDLF